MIKSIVLFNFVLLSLFTHNLYGWWWQKQDQTIEEQLAHWQKKQADSPNDAYVNYNLGVALYKANRFNEAQTNIDRALITATDQELKKRCYFNLGNVLYKDALTNLPTNWKAADIPDDALDRAISKTQQSIKKYDSVIIIDKQHNEAKSNQKIAKKLLEQLEKKKKQQQQKKPDDKNKDKDKNKDNKKNDQQQNNNDDQKQNDNDDQQQKNDNDQQQNGDQKTKDNDQQKQEEQKKKQDQEKQKQEPNKQKNDEEQEKSGRNNKNNQQEQSAPPPETIEERSARALLDDLQNDESQLQKALISKKLRAGERPLESNQKPW